MTNYAYLAYSNLNNATSFALKRIPNFVESHKNSKTQVTIDITLGNVISQFNDNPTVPGVIRDYLKIYSSFELKEVEIGSTGTTHGEGGIYAGVLKPLCKTILISGYYFTSKEKGKALIEGTKKQARFANLLCEIPTRYLHIAEREKQLIEKNNLSEPKKGFWQSIAEDAKISWIFESFIGGPGKAMTADIIGEYVIQHGWVALNNKYISYSKYLKLSASAAENLISSQLSYTNSHSFLSSQLSFTKINSFLAEDDLYSKIYKSGKSCNFIFTGRNSYFIAETGLGLGLLAGAYAGYKIGNSTFIGPEIGAIAGAGIGAGIAMTTIVAVNSAKMNLVALNSAIKYGASAGITVAAIFIIDVSTIYAINLINSYFFQIGTRLVQDVISVTTRTVYDCTHGVYDYFTTSSHADNISTEPLGFNKVYVDL